MNSFQCNLICSDAEALNILSHGAALGMNFEKDWPHVRPEFSLSRDGNSIFYSYHDVIFLIKPKWVIGPIVFDKIEDGYRSGTFSIQPRVNFACIEFYAPGERVEEGVRRLSSSALVLRSKPIDSESYLELEEIPDCKSTFAELVRKIQCKEIKIGSERFLISEGDFETLKEGGARPPFPYMDHFFL